MSLAVRTGSVPAAAKAGFLKGQTTAHALVDPDYLVWGMSVIRWTDGKYHGYYSRWPRNTKHNGWLTHCEIAHAVADRPEGPFRPTGAVIASRNPGGWDLVNAHNPYVCVADGKICLYYISDKLKGKFEAENAEAMPDDQWLKENRILVRNSQCIGVAIADQPAGPFVRSAKPVLEPHGNFKNIAVNPAVVFRDGTYTMIFKGDDTSSAEKFRIQFVAHSDRAEGPFVVQEKPVFNKVETEDACLWYDRLDKRFYTAVHVMRRPYLSLFSSEKGKQWVAAGDPEFLRKEIRLSDGSVWKPKRMERPFILTDDDGLPVMLYVSVAEGKQNGNIAIPLETVRK